MKGLWVISLLATVAASLAGFAGLAEARSAPQEASAAAIAVAIAVIPYCFCRACEGIANNNGNQLKRANELLAAIAKNAGAEMPVDPELMSSENTPAYYQCPRCKAPVEKTAAGCSACGVMFKQRAAGA
jgi:hypothetical protein